MKDRKEIQTLRGHSGYVQSIAISPDSTLIASVGCDRNVKIWKIGTWEEVSSFAAYSNDVRIVAFSTSCCCSGARVCSLAINFEVESKTW